MASSAISRSQAKAAELQKRNIPVDMWSETIENEKILLGTHLIRLMW
jgi:hypothetical protein